MKPIESTHRIRVLHIVGGMNRGGVETWLMHVLRHIDRERFQMDFMVHSAAPCVYDDEIRALGGRILPCLRYNRPWSYAKNYRNILAVYGPYDIVHSHVHHYSGYTLRLAHRAGIVARIAHSHTNAGPCDHSPNPLRRVYLSVANRWIRRHATIGLAPSRKAAEALFGPTWQNGSRCKLLYCGIDLDPFRAVREPSFRATLQLPPDAFVIGHVGSFVEVKNHPFLLEILRSVLDVDPKVCLLLIGDGPLRPSIESLAGQMNLSKRVVFTRLRSDVPRLLLSAVDLFVMPSLYEGLGLVCVEAQAAGVPCLFANTIPDEADVVPQLVTRLRLSQPASTWARVVLDIRSQRPRISQAEALAMIEASPFNIHRAITELTHVYESAVTSLATPGRDFRRLSELAKL
jgi:glycosyltransferase involved in cell wall biosynthesis